MLEVAIQQFLDPRGVELATHLRRGGGMHLRGSEAICVRRGPMRDRDENLGASVAADLDDEPVPSLVDELGEREIETPFGHRARLHRDAETGAARLPALDGDDERLAEPRVVAGIRVGSPDEDVIQDVHRVQLAGARSDEGVPRRAPRGLQEVAQLSALIHAGAPQGDRGRQLVALERVGANGVAEQRLVVAGEKSIPTPVLLVGPADGEIGSHGDLVIDDRTVANRRADDRVAATAQLREERIEVSALDDLV
jgi:hypothetical protein